MDRSPWAGWGRMFIVAGGLYIIAAVLMMLDPALPGGAEWYPAFLFVWGLIGIGVGGVLEERVAK